jgi:hypothetical protein
MSDFDPYLKWLGIRDNDRPVNHYRLLGLELFESDSDVISAAADRQMSHVRTYQNGARAELSQKILNELAVARRCLLVADQKKLYDAKLKKALAPKVKPAKPVVQASLAAPVIPPVTTAPPNNPIGPAGQARSAAPVAVNADADMRKNRQSREKKQMALSVVGWIGGGVAAVVVGAILINSGLLPGYGKDDDDPIEDRSTEIVQNDTNENKNNDSGFVDPPAKKDSTTTPKTNDDIPTKTDSTKAAENNSSNSTQPKVPDNKSVDDPTHPKFVWNRFNLQRYPAINQNTVDLLAKISESMQGQKLHQFEASSTGGGDDDYRLVGKGLLAGMVLTPYADGTIRTVLPLRLRKTGLHMGIEVGKRYNDTTFLVAKPGYAVGAIEVSTDHPMKCIRLIYMKILPDRLDTLDQYKSDWYPEKIRPITRIRNSVGLPIVGVYGRVLRGSNISNIGLMGAYTSDDHKLAARSSSPPNTNTTPPYISPGNTTGPSSEQPNTEKLEAPAEAAVNAARKEILVLYSAQYRRAQPDERALKSSSESVRTRALQYARTEARSLANTLIADASQSSEKPPIQYAMYREAATIGTKIGDLEIVTAAMKEIDQRFEFEYWPAMKKVVRDTAENSAASEAFMFRQTLDKVIDEAIQAGELKTADSIVSWTIDQVRKTDRKQADKYRVIDRRISSMIKVETAGNRALDVLNEKPDDTTANENVGVYEFVINDDLEMAMEYWAKCDNDRLLNLVKLSKSTNSEDSKSLLVLAEAWRDNGQANRTYKDKRFLEQALDLTQQASRLVDGIEQRRIERIANQLQAEIDEE